MLTIKPQILVQNNYLNLWLCVTISYFVVEKQVPNGGIYEFIYNLFILMLFLIEIVHVKSLNILYE